MGVIAGKVADVAKTVAQLVTDAAKTIAELEGIIGGFGQVIIAVADVQELLIQAMEATELATTEKFANTYKGVDQVGIDTAVVKNYTSQNPHLENIIEQIALDFGNWGIPNDGVLVTQLAQTISKKVKGTLGRADTSVGTFRINANQVVAWAVGYGEFAITQNSNGLVYSYTAALVFRVATDDEQTDTSEEPTDAAVRGPITNIVVKDKGKTQTLATASNGTYSQSKSATILTAFDPVTQGALTIGEKYSVSATGFTTQLLYLTKQNISALEFSSLPPSREA